jgi:nucleotide-binding universal stress UspA family protein
MAAVVGVAWPTEVVFGDPSDTIACVAEERGAALVVLGIGRHRLVDRVFGSETALRVMRSGDRPVLAVGPEADGVIRRAIVGVDFSAASLRAAAIAAQLVAFGGTLSLVHVRARADHSPPTWEGSGDAAADRTGELLRRFAVELRRGTTVDGRDACRRRDLTIGTATLIGDPAAELLDYAEQVGAELVAVGTRGRGLVERLLVGSVATDVVRGVSARLLASSVLCCPEANDATDVLHRPPRS